MRRLVARCFLSRRERGGHLAGTVEASIVVAGVRSATAIRPTLKADDGNVVIPWNNAFLQAIREGKIGPPMIARGLAILSTCMYDAWAAYDKKAVGTMLGGSLRRPASERTLANMNEAISFAAYRAAVDIYPQSTAMFDDLMASLGYDPTDTSTDVTTPQGIGNVACQAVLDFRHRDGSNQLGDEPGGQPGVPYSDYTGYAPVNDPLDVRVPFDPSSVHDPNSWQPLTYVDAAGNEVTPSFLGHQWNQVVPFALSSADQFRGPAPVQYGTNEFVRGALDLLDLSANLTDRQKMISEYWSDGPASETPPGHWNLLAQFVSERDNHGNAKRGVSMDVKMFFALNYALLDASIVAWDNKIAFDSVRPITAIRYLFDGVQVMAWGGPFQGTQVIDGGDWFPYQPTTFPTPPFAEYSSGHSTFSAAAAEILKRFTRS